MAAPAPKRSKAVLLSVLVLYLSICDARQDYQQHARKLAQECPELTIEATGESVCNTAVVPGAPNSTVIRVTARTTATAAQTTIYAVTQAVACSSTVSAPGKSEDNVTFAYTTTVSCNRPAGGWPTGGFNVTLTTTPGGVTACARQDTVFVATDVPLTLTPEDSSVACDATQTEVGFRATTTARGMIIVSQTATNNVTSNEGFGTPESDGNGTILAAFRLVYDRPADGWPAGGFNVTLRVKPTDASDACARQATTVISAPGNCCPELTLAAQGSSVCNTAVVPGAPENTTVTLTTTNIGGRGPNVNLSTTQGVQCDAGTGPGSFDGTRYTVSNEAVCTRPANGWPAGGFNVTFTANLQGAADACARQEIFFVATDVPLSITPQDSICNTATVFGGPAQRSVTFTSTTTATNVNVLSTTATNGVTASSGSGTGLIDSSGTIVSTNTIDYDRPEAGWPEPGFTVTFRAKPAGAEDGCARTATTFVATDVPLVLTAVGSSVCNSASGPATADVQFVGTTVLGVGGVTAVPGSLNVTQGVQISGQSNGTSTNQGAGTETYFETVTFQKPAGGWPSGGFSVNYAATAGNGTAAVCARRATATVTVTNPPGVPTVTGPNTASVCSNAANSTALSYTVTSNPAASVFSATASSSSVTCSAVPTGATTASVTCSPNSTTGQWPTGTFSVRLSATAGSPGCTTTGTSTGTTIIVNAAPSVAIQLLDSPVHCTTATSRALRYTVTSSTGARVTVAAATTTAGVTCSSSSNNAAGPAAVASGSTVTITCSSTAGPLSSTVSVTVTGSATANTCTGSTATTTTLNSVCCRNSYASVRAPPGSTTATATCLNCATAASTGVSYNNFAALNTPATAYDLLQGVSNYCLQGGTRVGAISVGCSTAGTVATVTIGPLNQTVAGASTPSFYLGCAAPSNNRRCTPTAWSGGSTCRATSAFTSCGGALTVPSLTAGVGAGSGTLTYRLGCTCNNVEWLFYVSSASLVVDPVGGVCP